MSHTKQLSLRRTSPTRVVGGFQHPGGTGASRSRAAVLALLLVSVSSCDLLSQVPNDRGGPPRELVTELEMFGITFHSERSGTGSPPAQALPVQKSDANGYRRIDLTNTLGVVIVFSPAPELALLAESDAVVPGGGYPIYDHRYSVEENDAFRTIAPSDVPLSEGNSDRYDGRVRVSGVGFVEPEFLLFGDNALRALAYAVPVEATHLELWVVDSADAPRRLVRRVNLPQLLAWQRYVVPSLASDR